MTGSEKPAKRGSLSAERIVSCAMALADQSGVDALSMRKLAAELGATAMSLYNHIDGKEALLDAMLDRVVSEIQSPDIGAPWRPMMERRARSMRDALLRHRWAAPLLMSRIVLGEAIMRDSEATLGCLVTAGFTYAQADWARNAIDSHVYGYTALELTFPVAPEDYQATAAQYLPLIDKQTYPFSHEASRLVAEGIYDGLTQFDFGLTLILDGVERWRTGAG